MPENPNIINLNERILSNNYADYIVPLRTNSMDFETQYEDYAAQILNDYYGIIHLDLNTDPFINLEIYGYSGIPKLFTLLDTTSLEASGILKVQNQPVLNLKGDGILIGFIDTGISYTQNAFRNSNGSTRITRIWDQTIESEQAPVGFYYGTEYTSADINDALNTEDPYSIVPSRDTNGHGTFLAGVACGSEDLSNQFIGVAPNSEIAMVKLKEAKPYLKEFYFANGAGPCYQENDIMLAIRYLALLGEKLKKPVVICISLGTNQGDHAGNAPIDNMISTLPIIYPQAIPVVAGGNESGRAHHFFNILLPDESFSDAEILVQEETAGFTLELWGEPPNIYSISIVSPLGEIIPRIAVRLGKREEISFILEKTVVQVGYELVQTTSGSQLIFLRFNKPTKGIWKLRVYCSDCSKNGFHIWLPITGLLEKDVKFLSPNPDTTITVPGYAYNVITPSTYNAYDNSIYLFSGRGFSRTGNIKPDFAAPGVNVMGPNLTDGYTTKSGSSIASAITAGSVALLIQWGFQRIPPRFFTVQELKIFFIRGATRNSKFTYPNKEWGYGILNVYEIFTSFMTF